MKMYERIRNYAEENGLRFNHLADKANIERKRFYRIINGQTAMTAEEFEKIFINGLSLEERDFFNKKFLVSKSIMNDSA
ncbi:helix-turn-helix transcriptional regulator [Aneurinibacillus sp. Ricciae_BoGa-3]|uniref:helix-turn-helix domain-containing protein n=1 Tax=Aneurinibacillus sp. Ricciae_BoGa-3 TaxID=3022697 RepID=UPI0023416F14|nr:helix-turn-helix transcriptional regulator [Aneurinibacillus sp. Ricciae_BoGa-3]WCK53880.1 helix-turn-helix transcriptional regulator [Aneurinibacillus sp. Ricciae_BoGa-3]